MKFQRFLIAWSTAALLAPASSVAMAAEPVQPDPGQLDARHARSDIAAAASRHPRVRRTKEFR